MDLPPTACPTTNDQLMSVKLIQKISSPLFGLCSPGDGGGGSVTPGALGAHLFTGKKKQFDHEKFWLTATKANDKN